MFGNARNEKAHSICSRFLVFKIKRENKSEKCDKSRVKNERRL